MPPSSVALHCKSCTAHCPRAMWQCVAGFPLPAAPRQCGSALQEFQCPLAPSAVAVHSRSYTARCPQAVWQCIAGFPLPTAPRQCGSTLHEFHRPPRVYDGVMPHHMTHVPVNPQPIPSTMGGLDFFIFVPPRGFFHPRDVFRVPCTFVHMVALRLKRAHFVPKRVPTGHSVVTLFLFRHLGLRIRVLPFC